MSGEADNPNERALNCVSLAVGEGDTALLQDELTDTVYEVKPRFLTNAAGLWIDFANRGLDLSTCFSGGTKDSHFVFPL